MKLVMYLGSGKINIMLTNNCTNTDGEYISSFIENGTGVYSPNGTTRPDGWWYPSRYRDPNPTKKKVENDEGSGSKYIAFTWGQVPKPILHDSFEIIMAQLDGWIYDYFHRKGV